MSALHRYAFLESFACLGPDCPDTCCHGWNMPVDARQQALYAAQAPELLASIDPQERAMRRDPATDDCVKLSDGLCGIQNAYGTDFVGDSCHFFPRILRDIGGATVMGAALSCPEITRLVLATDDPFALQQATLSRLPQKLANPVPAALHGETARAITAQFIALAGDTESTPEWNMMRIVYSASGLAALDSVHWEYAVPTLLATPALDLPPAIARVSDAQALYYGLGLLMAFGPPTRRPRLMQTMATMAQALDCEMLWASREIKTGPDAMAAYPPLLQRWQARAQTAFAPVLRRWLQAQLMMMGFPFGGFRGVEIQDRAAILAVRFATVKLALMCHVQADSTLPDEETIVRIIQSISRFMDHLGDAELSLMIYRDAGWLEASRLHGLVDPGVLLQRSDF